jgi:hypothetical protein
LVPVDAPDELLALIAEFVPPAPSRAREQHELP